MNVGCDLSQRLPGEWCAPTVWGCPEEVGEAGKGLRFYYCERKLLLG